MLVRGLALFVISRHGPRLGIWNCSLRVIHGHPQMAPTAALIRRIVRETFAGKGSMPAPHPDKSMQLLIGH